MKTFMKGIGGGFLIGIGGAVFLACDDRIIGAVLFSIALMAICGTGAWLYTGKVCYKTSIKELSTGLFGNVVGVMLAAIPTVLCSPVFRDNATALMTAKLAQPGYETIARGIMCEACIYIAVEIWKRHNTLIGVFVAVPVFILAGFEHSIFDVYCMLMSGIVSTQPFLALIGNTIGGIAIMMFNECIGRMES